MTKGRIMFVADLDVYAPQSVRLARLMNLTDAEDMSDTQLAHEIGMGLPADTAEHLFLQFPIVTGLRDLIPEATLRRAKVGQKPLSREHSERLYEMSRVMDAALQAYGNDRTLATAFLTRPHPLLEGETPIALARISSAGTDAVVALIGRAQASVAL
jgi:putative toxin-antitoxin system antitoxin component (TIGR02293 family)